MVEDGKMEDWKIEDKKIIWPSAARRDLNLSIFQS
jgi:hypothetical protein